MKKNYVIEGPLHPINVKICTQKRIRKQWGKNEEIYGLFDPSVNTIFISSGLPPDQMLHTLMHEIVHAIDAQLSVMTEEGKADVIGSYMVRLFKLKNVAEILK